jgi:hypothetical protein
MGGQLHWRSLGTAVKRYSVRVITPQRIHEMGSFVHLNDADERAFHCFKTRHYVVVDDNETGKVMLSLCRRHNRKGWDPWRNGALRHNREVS